MSSEEVEHSIQTSFDKKVHHPPCVRHLLRFGVPSDMRYDYARTLLLRYVVTKRLNDAQATSMAQSMLKFSNLLDEALRTNDMEDFLKSLLQARQNPKANEWCCEDVWSSRKLRERGACTGWVCEYYNSEPSEFSRGIVEKEAPIEREALTYLLNNPESLADGILLRCEGFVEEYQCREGTCLLLNRVLWHVCRYLAYHGRPIRRSKILDSLSRSPKMRRHLGEIAQYLQRLESSESCQYELFVEYLNIINECGARLRAQELIRQAALALASNSLPLDVALSTLGRESNTLSITACERNSPLEQDLGKLVGNLFSKKGDFIPARSEWLNSSLGGGWKPGMFYALYASSTAEATDFGAWCAEFAAQRRFPVVFVSSEISKEEFVERALARRSRICTSEFLGYRKDGFCESEIRMLERVIEGGERLSRQIAQHLVMIEANPDMTCLDLRSALSNAKKRVGTDHYLPTLLILDQLTAEPLNDDDSQAQNNSLFARLKRQIQDPAAAIIDVFSTTAIQRESAAKTEKSNNTLCHKTKTGLSVPDYSLTLQSKSIKIIGKKSEKTLNQLDLAREWYKRRYPRFRKDINKLFDETEGGHSLDEATTSYARISLFGRDARAIANPVIIYERALHEFRTLNIEPLDLEKFNALVFDKDPPVIDQTV